LMIVPPGGIGLCWYSQSDRTLWTSVVLIVGPGHRRKGSRAIPLMKQMRSFPRSRHFQSCDRDQRGQGCAAPAGLDLDATSSRVPTPTIFACWSITRSIRQPFRPCDREIVTTLRGKRHATSIRARRQPGDHRRSAQAGGCAFRSGQEADD